MTRHDEILAHLNVSVAKTKTVDERINDLAEQIKPITDLLTVSTEKSDKKGYDFKVTRLGEVVLTKEYIKSEVTEENDGTNYLKPITYSDGMSVTKDLWYTDGEDIWLSLKDGVPKDFSDEEYFDIIK